jgi:hypothetical protein
MHAYLLQLRYWYLSRYRQLNIVRMIGNEVEIEFWEQLSLFAKTSTIPAILKQLSDSGFWNNTAPYKSSHQIEFLLAT